MGEVEYYQLVLSIASRAKLGPSLFFILLPAFFMSLLGGTIIIFYPNPDHYWGFYFGVGVLAYAIVLAIYGPLFFLRLRKRSHAS